MYIKNNKGLRIQPTFHATVWNTQEKLMNVYDTQTDPQKVNCYRKVYGAINF